MKEVTISVFVNAIAKDYNLEVIVKKKKYFNDFPIVNGKRKINSSGISIIVDKEGNSHPYMLNPWQRNDEKLVDFDYIYVNVSKSLKEITDEAGISLQSKRTKICEGGGWYSWGVRYTYKDIYCEF